MFVNAMNHLLEESRGSIREFRFQVRFSTMDKLTLVFQGRPLPIEAIFWQIFPNYMVLCRMMFAAWSASKISNHSCPLSKGPHRSGLQPIIFYPFQH
jgi:hypothetical protein